MSLDHYITTEPEPSEEWAACDCCGKHKPLRQMSSCGAYGIDTWACNECRGWNEEDNDDGPPLTQAECEEYTREMLAPCSDYARRRGCTCSMSANAYEEVDINRNCPLHGHPIDPDDAYDYRSL